MLPSRAHGSAVLFAALLLLGGGCVSDAEAARDTLRRAEELREDGQTAQAVARYEAAAELDPSLAQAYGSLAAIRFEQKRYEQARRLAAHATELAPNVAEHHETLGLSLMELERWDGARRALLQALSLDPEREHLHEPLGRARLESGDREGALRSWKRVLEVEPRDADARLSVVELLVGELEARLDARDAERRHDEAPASVQRHRASFAKIVGLRDEARAMIAAVSERALDGDDARSRLRAVEEQLSKAAERVERHDDRAVAALQDPSGAFGFGGLGLRGGGATAGGGTASGGRFTIQGSVGGQGTIGVLRALGSGGSGAGPTGPSVQATTRGSYSEATAKRIGEGHGPAVQLCYELRRRAGTASTGAVVATVEIDARGRVSNVTVRDDGVGDAAVVQCIRQLVDRWRFPAPSSPATIELRFDFAP